MQKSDVDHKYSMCALARIEKMDFSSPMHIGEVAEVEAKVTFTATHSLEVTVNVFAGNMLNGLHSFSNLILHSFNIYIIFIF